MLQEMHDSDDETLSTDEAVVTDVVKTEETAMKHDKKTEGITSIPDTDTQEVSNSPMVIEDTLKSPELLTEADVKMEIDSDEENQ